LGHTHVLWVVTLVARDGDFTLHVVEAVGEREREGKGEIDIKIEREKEIAGARAVERKRERYWKREVERKRERKG